MIGRRVSHFEIEAELGRGAMGAVYRARDLDLQRSVALKTLPPESDGTERRRRFLEEARAASSLSHPGIVTIYEVGSDDGVDYIAMELVEGRDLAEVLGDGPLTETRVLDAARELARALAAAHARGIVHRDLKPANIMVDGSGRLRILDFGLAKRLPAVTDDGVDQTTIEQLVATAPGAVLGTPAYMAPEQARGHRADHRADHFAFGCILYEMLTGSRPFAGSSHAELFSSILRDRPAPPSVRRATVSEVWDPLIERLLAKEPEGRFEATEDLVRALDDLEVGRPRRRSGVVVAVAVAALAAIAAVAFLLSRGGATDDGFPDFRFRLLLDRPGSEYDPWLAPDGERVAFVAEDEDGVGQLHVVSVASGEVVQLTSGPEAASRPFWARDGRIVFQRRSGVWDLDPASGEERHLVEGGSAPVRSDDGRWLAYNSRRQVWLARGDGTDQRPLASLEPSHFGYFSRPVFSPSGNELAVFVPHPDRPLGDLWVVPVPEGPARQLTRVDFLSHGDRPMWSADGRWIVFAADHEGSFTLWRVAPSGGEPLAVTTGAGSDRTPSMSAAGDRLVYANGRQEGRIDVFDPSTGEQRTAHARRDMLILPALSPDGTRVAYFTRTPHSIQIFVHDLRSGETAQVTSGDGHLNTNPSWSGDGQHLYYYQQEPSFSWRRIGLDGSGDELVLESWLWTERIQSRISPDGKEVVYTVREGNHLLETRIRDLATGRERTLPLALDSPQWVDEGREILGATWRPSEVYLCRVEEGECRRITSGWQARMGADGRTVYALRGSPPRVWSHDLVTGDEKELHTVEGYDAVDFGWDVTPTGQIVYHTQFSTDMELWLGEAGD